jgi:hypothetical protein
MIRVTIRVTVRVTVDTCDCLRVIGCDVSFFSLKTRGIISGGFSPASLSRLSVIRKTFDSRRNTKVSSKATPYASSLYMRHADSLLALNAFFVFVVEASSRERCRNVQELKETRASAAAGYPSFNTIDRAPRAAHGGCVFRTETAPQVRTFGLCSAPSPNSTRAEWKTTSSRD